MAIKKKTDIKQYSNRNEDTARDAMLHLLKGAPVPDDQPSEPNAAVTEVADETEMPLPSDPRTFFLGGLFALGVLAALYVASSVILSPWC